MWQLAPAMTRVGGDSGFVMEKGDGEAEKRDNALGEQGFRRENRVQGAEHGWYRTVSMYRTNFRTTLGLLL